MSTPEGLLTAACVRFMQKQRDAGKPIFWLKIHGHAAQRRGEPDLDIVRAGRALKIELKKKGGKPTSIQVYRMKQWESAGATTACVDSIEEFRVIIMQALERS